MKYSSTYQLLAFLSNISVVNTSVVNNSVSRSSTHLTMMLLNKSVQRITDASIAIKHIAKMHRFPKTLHLIEELNLAQNRLEMLSRKENSSVLRLQYAHFAENSVSVNEREEVAGKVSEAPSIEEETSLFVKERYFYQCAVHNLLKKWRS